MEVSKSDRHSKIAGNFFENYVLYFLSRNGFECAIIDHVGIDILARNPKTKELMGISVKGRTRNDGERRGRIKIDAFEKHRDKLLKACQDFGNATPYFAFAVDAESSITAVMVPLAVIDEEYPIKNTALNWSMNQPALNEYLAHPDMRLLIAEVSSPSWW